MYRRRAFTLIELIVVMAISTMLLTIIAIPMIHSFNITRAAQGYANAQRRASDVISMMEKEIGNAVAVRDNSGTRGSQYVVVPGSDGFPETLLMSATKLDFYRAALGEPLRGPSGAYINPGTGMEDPTTPTPIGQVNLPVARGLTMVRYFIGLARPLSDTDRDGLPDRAESYNNPYDGLLMKRNSDRDNLFVLYRGEVQPFVFSTANNRFEVNTRAFVPSDPADLSRDPIYDDPAFFTMMPGVDYDPSIGPRQPNLTPVGEDKAKLVQYWTQNATIVTEVSRYDMINVEYDRRNGKAFYDNNVPRVTPLIRIQPTRVASEAALGEVSARVGEETDNAVKLGADTYRTEYGAWSNLLMRIWPSDYPTAWGYGAGQRTAGQVRRSWGSGGRALNTPYMVGRPRLDLAGNVLGFSLYAYDPTSGVSDLAGGLEVFDYSLYNRFLESGLPGGFSAAVDAANARSAWLTIVEPAVPDLFVPVFPNARAGRVIASFDIREVGQLGVGYNENVPTVDPFGGSPVGIGTGLAVTPNDPMFSVGAWTDYTKINERFGKLWRDWAILMPGLDRSRYVKRFVLLGTVPQSDGTPSPLNKTPYATGGSGFRRAYVQPGSEVVIGPDQGAGPNYGRLIRYVRTTQRPVGPNEYFINYVDQPDPDYAGIGIPAPPAIHDPSFYDPNNLISAIVQPQFRAGYVEFNSRFGEPIPEGNIFVTYRFQFNEQNDVIAVDYDSSELLEVVLTVKTFPLTSMPNNQVVTLKGSAVVRNFIR